MISFFARNLKWFGLGLTVFVLLWFSFLPQLVVDPSAERMFLNDDPTKAAYDTFAREFGGDSTVILAFERNDAKSWIQTEALRVAWEIHEALEALPNVERVNSVLNFAAPDFSQGDMQVIPIIDPYSPDSWDTDQIDQKISNSEWVHGNLLSEDQAVITFVVQLFKAEKSGKEATEFIEAMDEILPQLESKSNSTASSAGGPVFLRHLRSSIRADLSFFIPITLVLLSAILFFTFGTILGTVLPLIAVNIGVGATLGFMAFLGYPIATVTVILPPLLLVIGVTNVVHILNAIANYGENPKTEAIEKGLADVLGASTLSSITTAIGFGALTLNDVDTVFQTGVISCFGILATYATAVILTPSFCAVFGIEKIVRFRDSGSTQSNLVDKYLNATAHLTTTNPKKVALACIATVLVVSAGFPLIQVETNLRSYFPKNSPIRESGKLFEERLSGSVPGEILIQAPNSEQLLSTEGLRFQKDLEQFLIQYEHIHRTQGLASVIEPLHKGLGFQDFPGALSENTQSLFWYEIGAPDLHNQLVRKDQGLTHISYRATHLGSTALHKFVSETDAWIDTHAPDGWTVDFADSNTRFVHLVKTLVPAQMSSLGLALVLIWIALIFAMRGFAVPTLAMIPNVAPIAMILGIMGWAGIPMNFATSMIPSIAIGLAVDDTIHVFARFLKFHKTGMPSKEAVYETLAETGRAVLFTSIILFAGFAILAGSNFVPNRYFGILTAVTTITAILADLYLAPALLMIFFKEKAK